MGKNIQSRKGGIESDWWQENQEKSSPQNQEKSPKNKKLNYNSIICFIVYYVEH
jgi:hypothetical protein